MICVLSTSKEFQDALFAEVIKVSAYIVMADQKIIPTSFRLYDDIYDEDSQNFLGTFISRYGEMVLSQVESLSLENQQFQLYCGVELKDGTMSDVLLGTFYVYEVEEQQNDIEKRVRFADARIYFNKKAELNKIPYPICVKELFTYVADILKVPYMDIKDLPNADFIIPKEVYWGAEATYADIIKAIAQATISFAKIEPDGTLALKWFNNTDVTLSGDTYYTLERQENYGPVNAVVLGRSPQNDHIYLRDEDSIAAHGLCEVKIVNNPILDIDRKQTIQPVFQRLSKLQFTPISLEGKGNPSFQSGDGLHIQTLDGTVLSTYIFNHQLDFDGALTSTIKTRSLTKTEIEYGAADSIEKRLLETELKVDKVKGEITSQITDTTTRLDRIEASHRYDLEIYSSQGNVFKNGNIQTELSVRVLSWDVDVSDLLDTSRFSWQRISKDEEADSTWNKQHEKQKKITISSADLNVSAIFYCLLDHQYTAFITLSNVYDGEAGKAGEDGISTYFHVKYAEVEAPTDEDLVETPSTYIGTYVDHKEQDSPHASAYTWFRFQGSDGIPGKNGQDGKTSYLHIRYSDDGGKTFTENNGKTPGVFIGQYTDFTAEDQSDVHAYTWTRLKGEKEIVASDVPLENTDCLWLDTSMEQSLIKRFNKDTGLWEAINDFTAEMEAMEETITEFYNSSLEQTKSDIISKVEEGFLAKDEWDNIQQLITDTVVKQTSEGIDISFHTTKELIDSLSETVDTNRMTIEKFIRFVNGRIQLGQSDSVFLLEITNSRISFLENNSEVAYISDSQLVITDANIKNSLSLGKFHFMPRTNGNMSIKFVP